MARKNVIILASSGFLVWASAQSHCASNGRSSSALKITGSVARIGTLNALNDHVEALNFDVAEFAPGLLDRTFSQEVVLENVLAAGLLGRLVAMQSVVSRPHSDAAREQDVYHHLRRLMIEGRIEIPDKLRPILEYSG